MLAPSVDKLQYKQLLTGVLKFKVNASAICGQAKVLRQQKVNSYAIY